MPENTFWIIAAIIIIIVIVIALLSLFGVQLGPFSAYFNRLRLGSTLCNQMVNNGCVDSYKPELENAQCGIKYDEIGQRLRDPNKDNPVNNARFGEVCEYIGFKNFDPDCLKYCNCKIS